MEWDGGSVLIIVLVSVMMVEQHIAQATNMIYFIPTAITAILIHIKKGNVEKSVSKKLFFPTIIGSGVGAYLTTLVNPENLRKYFGLFLLFIRYL